MRGTLLTEVTSSSSIAQGYVLFAGSRSSPITHAKKTKKTYDLDF